MATFSLNKEKEPASISPATKYPIFLLPTKYPYFQVYFIGYFYYFEFLKKILFLQLLPLYYFQLPHS